MSGFPQGSQFFNVTDKRPYHIDELCGFVWVGGQGEALLLTKRDDICFLWGYGDNRFSRSEDSVHFAWDHHTFEPTLYRDDMRIRRGEN